jgi:hypothetical protein
VNIITINRDGSDEVCGGDDGVADEREAAADGDDGGDCSIPSHGPLRTDYPPPHVPPQ